MVAFEPGARVKAGAPPPRTNFHPSAIRAPSITSGPDHMRRTARSWPRAALMLSSLVRTKRAADAIFADDPSLMTDAGAVLLRPGKALRLAEVDLAERTYAELGIPVIGRIEASGTVEGGDTLWLDERTLAVGPWRSARTTRGFGSWLAMLAPYGIETITVDLPHWRGPDECLHLMSFISPVADRLAVVYLPLMSVPFVKELQRRGWSFIEVPDEEFETHGCNVLALAPLRVLVCDDSPITRDRLRVPGCEVVTYVGNSSPTIARAGRPVRPGPILRSADARAGMSAYS